MSEKQAIAEALDYAIQEHGLDDMGFNTSYASDIVIEGLNEAGYKVVLRNPCRCGCGKPATDHLCPCGCGHTYDDAVSKVMSGPMYLNREQAESNIDEHPDVPCKW